MLLADPSSSEATATAQDGPYWPQKVVHDIARQHWSHASVNHHIDLDAWSAFLATLPRDPYVNCRWKRMSWLQLRDDGEVECMGECPMAQGGRFNDAESMADKLRYYPALEPAFTERDDFKTFVRHWAELWGIGPREPILVQITGVRGEGQVDPLQGQGIHADGCKHLSVLVLKRDNVEGATNHLYADKGGQHCLADVMLEPGEILHLSDDELFHSVDALTQADPAQPFERFIIIINSRFVDGFQNRMLRRHFPDAVLNEVF